MTRWWRARRLRLQLTLWHLLVMGVVLAVYAAVVFASTTRNLLGPIDQQLIGDFQWAAAVVAPQRDGTFECPLCEEVETEALAIAFESSETLGAGPWLQVWSPEGALLYRSPGTTGLEVADSRTLALRPVQEDGYSSRLAGDIPMRVLTRHVQVCPPGTAQPRLINGVFTCPTATPAGSAVVAPLSVVIQVARSEVAVRQEMNDLLLILLLGLPLSVGVAGVGGYTLARRALGPVDDMAARARTISAERLHDRLPVENADDEMGHLATVFNETLGRLEASFEQMRRFTTDVSHELRTPLTAIQSVGEVGLRGPRDEVTYRRIIGSMLEEGDRLSSLVDRLLTLSRAETAEGRSPAEVVDLPGLAKDVATHLGVLAEEKGQTIAIEGTGELRCCGDRVVLRQALINLVHNAIKFSPERGRVRICLAHLSERAIVEVIDEGPGVPESVLPRLFERFSRGSASGEVGGVGLGLSIARRWVEANRGSLTLAATGPDGTTFRISLPALAPAQRVR